MKLEVVVIPVSDVDRAKGFQRMDGASTLTAPPAKISAWSSSPRRAPVARSIRKGVTSAAPGSAESFLVVTDIVAARDQLVAAGVEVGEFFHDGPEGRGPGLHPERLSYRSRALFNDPDGNVWQMQEVMIEILSAAKLARLPSAPQATWRARFGVRRPLTARGAIQSDAIRGGFS